MFQIPTKRISLFASVLFLSLVLTSSSWTSLSTADFGPNDGVLLGSNIATNRFGELLSSAGDFNGDGIQDFAVASKTSLYIIFGNPNGLAGVSLATLTPSQGIKIDGFSSGSRQRKIFPLGDWNGDGIDDIVVRDAVNLIFIIYGKSTGLQNFNLGSITTAQGVKIQGLALSNLCVGDFNGDGKKDIFISYGSNSVTNTADVIMVYYGGQNKLTSNLVLGTTPTQGASAWILSPGNYVFVTSMVLADLNGDGFQDVVSFQDPPTLSSTPPTVFVAWGGPTKSGSINVSGSTSTGILIRLLPSWRNLLPLASVGDVNGDGLEDVAFNFPNDPHISVIFYGNKTLATDPIAHELTKIGTRGYYLRTGSFINGGGDHNGDGLDDILLGAPAETVNAVPNAGVLNILHSFIHKQFNLPTDNFPAGKRIQLTGHLQDQFFGESATMTDINGDGKVDLIVGAPGMTVNGVNKAGGVYIFYGKPIVCEPPFLPNAEENSCFLPCPKGLFVKEGQECSLTCELPWISSVVKGRKLCHKPCLDTEVFNTEIRACHPICQPTWVSEVIDGINSCRMPCTAPWITEIVDGVSICKKPCAEGEVWNRNTNACQVGCFGQWLYSPARLPSCIKPCGSGFFFFLTKQCSTTCTGTYASFDHSGLSLCGRKCTNVQFSNSQTNNCQNNCLPPWQILTGPSGLNLCQNPCPDGSIWNPHDQICQASCPVPWISSTQNGVRVCEKPCDEGSFWNTEENACQDFCSSPWISHEINGAPVCERPCESGLLYNSEDNRCQLGCSAPHIPSTIQNVDVCSMPCGEGSFWNTEENACQETCQAPWVSSNSGGIDLCEKPCSTEEIWNQDSQVCQEACLSPRVVREVSGVDACEKPCPPELYFYNIESNICQEGCPGPWTFSVVEGVEVCGKPCPEGLIWNAPNVSCVEVCPVGSEEGIFEEVPICESKP